MASIRERSRRADRGGAFVTVAGGRQVSYAVYGAPRGPAVLHFHAGGTSRLEAALAHRWAVSAGVRIICQDRPGYGQSDPHPGRTFVETAGDALHVLDAVGAERAVTTGYSAGAPHALALRLIAPDRVMGAVLINSAGEGQSRAWSALPARRRLAIRLLTRRPIYALAMWAIRRAIARGARRDPAIEPIAAAFAEGGAQGPEATLAEVGMCYDRHWALDWSRARSPILLLQGERDPNLPWAKAVARGTPNVTLDIIPGGHRDGGTEPVWRRVFRLAHEWSGGVAS